MFERLVGRCFDPSRLQSYAFTLGTWRAAANEPGRVGVNTPTHLVIGLAVAGRPGATRRNLAALAGGFAPDAGLFALYAWAKWVQGVSDRVIFGTLYGSPAWQTVLAANNALLVWLALTGLAWWLERAWPRAFALSGLAHLACDLPVHHGDAYPYLWPLSDWRFASPVSYWNPAHYGDVVKVLELLLVAVLAAGLARRHRQTWLRLGLGLVAIGAGAGLAYWAWIF